VTLVTAAQAAVRAILRIGHPEEPDDPFVSYVSTPRGHGDEVVFDIDGKDLASYPSVARAVSDAIVGALEAGGIRHARVRLAPAPTQASPAPPAPAARVDPWRDLTAFARTVPEKRQLLDWYVRLLAPMTLHAADLDAAPMSALGPLTEPFAVDEALAALTTALRAVLERLGLRDGSAPGRRGVGDELQRSVRQGEDWEDTIGRNLDASVCRAIGDGGGRGGVHARELVSFDMAGHNDTGRSVVDLVWSAAWAEATAWTWSRAWYRARAMADEAVDGTPAEALYAPLRDDYDTLGDRLGAALLDAATSPDDEHRQRVLDLAFGTDAWKAFAAGLDTAGLAPWYAALRDGLACGFADLVDETFLAERAVAIVATITAKLMELSRWLVLLEARAQAYRNGADDDTADTEAHAALSALVADSYALLDAFEAAVAR
jgi:hypothetical protein